jgi:hypothetical protein
MNFGVNFEVCDVKATRRLANGGQSYHSREHCGSHFRLLIFS